jgi:hypothetical protein
MKFMEITILILQNAENHENTMANLREYEMRRMIRSRQYHPNFVRSEDVVDDPPVITGNENHEDFTMEEVSERCRISKGWYDAMDKVLRMKVISSMGMNFYFLTLLEYGDIFGPQVALNIGAHCEAVAHYVSIISIYQSHI